MTSAVFPPRRRLTLLLPLLLVLLSFFCSHSWSLIIERENRYLWIGAVSDSEFSIRIESLAAVPVGSDQKSGSQQQSQDVHEWLLLSTSPSFHSLTSTPVDLVPLSHADNYNIVKLKFKNLVHDTQYYIAISSSQTIDDGGVHVASVRTFPKKGSAASVTFAIASCMKDQSEAAAYQRIADDEAVDFFIHTGDLFYKDIATNNRNKFAEAYKEVLYSPVQQQLFRKKPVFYIYDDHDFGENDCDGTSPSKPAALWAFDNFYPHFHLKKTPQGESVGFQTFTYGNVRFIIMDTRSQSYSDVTHPEKLTILGQEQMKWLLKELSNAYKYNMVVLVSSRPWQGEPSKTEKVSSWATSPEEREQIANYISEHAINNVVMIAGDSHMLAIDNGVNTDYSTEGSQGAGFPLLQSAPLSGLASQHDKGGRYSEGCYGFTFGLNQLFSTVTITDEKDKTCVSFKSYDANIVKPVLSLEKCITSKSPSLVVKGNQGASRLEQCILPNYPKTGSPFSHLWFMTKHLVDSTKKKVNKKFDDWYRTKPQPAS